MYQKIKQKISENKDMIMIGAIVVLTIVVVRTRATYVQDVYIGTNEGLPELYVEFTNGARNDYPLMK